MTGFKKMLAAISAGFAVFLSAAPAAQAAYEVPEICKNLDAKALMEDAVQASSYTAQGSSAGGAYSQNKWLVSCAVSYGVKNLDGAIDVLKTDAAYNMIARKTGAALRGSASSNEDNSPQSEGGGVRAGGGSRGGSSGSSSGNRNTSYMKSERTARMIENTVEALEAVSTNAAFSSSLFDRTYQIGIYLIIFTFIISLIIKLYSMLTGHGGVDAADLVMYFMRLVSLIGLMTFMRPLAFFGMGLSTDIANLLLNAPISATVMSGVLYNSASYPSQTGATGASPWLTGSAAVSSGYGVNDFNRRSPGGHKGIDYAVRNHPIVAPADGVAYPRTDYREGGFGRYISLTVDSDSTKPYTITHRAGHLSEFGSVFYDSSGALITGGVKVRKGEELGVSGNDGTPMGGGSYGYHLHADTQVSGGEFKSATFINPAMVYDFEAGVISDLSGTPSSSVASSSPYTQGSSSVMVSTGQGSYTVTGQDALTMGLLFSEMLDLKEATFQLDDSWISAFNPIRHLKNATFSALAYLAKLIANAVLTVLIILSDVMMALTLALGPFVIALSLLPQFESFLHNWIKGYVTFLFYQPLASCFQVLAIVMLAATLDSGFGPFLICCICYVGACMKIPNIADGLSASALTSIATMMAFAPAMAALKTGHAGLSYSLGAGMGGGRSGRAAVKLTAAAAAALCILGAAAGQAGAVEMTQEEKEAVINIMTPKTYPDRAKYEEAVKSAGKSTGDPLLDGVHNASYTNAVDAPITRFVLGASTIDVEQIYVAAEKARASWIGGSHQLSPASSSSAARIQTFLGEAQNSITTLLMREVPIYLLLLMFMIQIGFISYLKVLGGADVRDRVSYLAALPRLVLYMLLILVYPWIVGSLITLSNYISNAIVPILTQDELFNAISSKTLGVMETGGFFEGLIYTVFRALTVLSIKILLIARDIFLCISVIIGPICIALGYFTRYRDPDHIHRFFSGWLESFIKVLFWGPLASIMLAAMGMLSVLTSFDMLSTLSVTITGLAFLYAAASLPQMAEKVSSVAVLGLLTAASPVMMGGLGLAWKGGLGAGIALNRRYGWTNGIAAGLNSLLGGLNGVIRGGGSGGSGGGAQNLLRRPAQSQHTGGGAAGAAGAAAGGAGPQGGSGISKTLGGLFGGTGKQAGGQNAAQASSAAARAASSVFGGGAVNTGAQPAAAASVAAGTTRKNGAAAKASPKQDAAAAAAEGLTADQARASGFTAAAPSGGAGEDGAPGNAWAAYEWQEERAGLLDAASSETLMELNSAGVIEGLGAALSESGLGGALFNEEGQFEGFSAGGPEGLAEGAATAKALLAAASVWNASYERKHNDLLEKAGVSAGKTQETIRMALAGIDSVMKSYREGSIDGAQARGLISQQLAPAIQGLDAAAAAVKAGQGGSPARVPQVPAPGALFNDGALGGGPSFQAAADKLEAESAPIIEAFAGERPYEQIFFGEHGLLNNKAYLEQTGLANEERGAACIATAMAGLGAAKEMADGAYGKGYISEKAYSKACADIQASYGELESMAADYMQGALSMDGKAIEQTSSALLARAGASLQNNVLTTPIDRYEKRMQAASAAALQVLDVKQIIGQLQSWADSSNTGLGQELHIEDHPEEMN